MIWDLGASNNIFSFVGSCLHQISSVECAAYHRAGYGMRYYKRIDVDTLSHYEGKCDFL